MAQARNEKPELGGVQVRQRKRNINAPQDPQSFAEAIIEVFDRAEESLEQQKEKGAIEAFSTADVLTEARKTLETADLEFSRYGETLFQLFYTGYRLAPGGKIAENSPQLKYHILTEDEDYEKQKPYHELFILLLRRKPFLLKKLEDVIITLLVSLELYKEEDRRKLALAVAGLFLNKIPVLPEQVLGSLLSERLVEGGVVLAFLTHFIRGYLAVSSQEELVSLLNKGRVTSRLDDFFPIAKRSFAAQSQHFTDEDLPGMAAWLTRRNAQVKVAQIRAALKDVLEGEEDVPMERIISLCQRRRTEGGLENADVAKVLFLTLMESISPSGRANTQLANTAHKLLKEYEKLLNEFIKAAKDERALMDTLQSFCYENQAFIKLFAELVRILYDLDVLAEDTIQHWATKGTNTKARTQFLADLQPFLKWLEEAEEEEDDEDEEDEEDEDK